MSAPAACPIVTRSYFSYACVLAESYARHHPRVRVYVLVVDGLPPGADAGVVVVESGSLELTYVQDLAVRYGPTELATAVKPTFLAHVLERKERVVYLDPDVVVRQPFDELRRVLRLADIVLTPHTLAPFPLRGSEPETELVP